LTSNLSKLSSPQLTQVFVVAFTFFLTVIAWIFFRSDSLSSAFFYLKNMISMSMFTIPSISIIPDKNSVFNLIILLIFIIIEWMSRNLNHPLESINQLLPKPIRWSIYVLIFIITILFSGKPQDFIYFQF
jgi:hypothetical protein